MDNERPKIEDDINPGQLPQEFLEGWASYIEPAADLSTLTREQLVDIYLTFRQERDFIVTTIADRQKETGYPDRLFTRVLMHVGESNDQRLNLLQENKDNE